MGTVPDLVGYFWLVDRVYLSAEELETVQGVLDRFVGLPLTDVWYMNGRIFEFGEQKHFINRSGEDSYHSLFTVKVMNGFTVKGVSKTELTEKNFVDSDRNWTDLAMEFSDLWRKNDMVVQSASVGRDGKIDFEISHGITIAINGRTWTREFEVWLLNNDKETFLYDSQGLGGGEKFRGPKISKSGLTEVKAEFEKLVGMKIRIFCNEQDLRIGLLKETSSSFLTVSSLRTMRIRRADKIVHWDSAELLELWERSWAVDSIKIDDQGTLAIWLEDWVMVFRVNAPHSWKYQSDVVEIVCDVEGLRIIPR